MQARGYAREECIAVGDSREDMEAAGVVGTFWLVRNAVERDPALSEDIARHDNVRVAEAPRRRRVRGGGHDAGGAPLGSADVGALGRKRSRERPDATRGAKPPPGERAAWARSASTEQVGSKAGRRRGGTGRPPARAASSSARRPARASCSGRPAHVREVAPEAAGRGRRGSGGRARPARGRGRPPGPGRQARSAGARP